MAARQQPKGTGFGVQYDDLVPKFKWEDQPEATLLTIYIPGFTKEQVNVTYVHSSKMIRVTGESPLANRKWSRFIETFTVPQNCIVDKIHGSFNNNAVTITMPKESIKKMLREEAISKERADAKKLQEEAISKEMAVARKLQKEAISKEMAETRKLIEEAIGKEMAEVRKLLEETIAKEKAEARKFQEEAIAKEKAEARKPQEETIAKEKAEAKKFPEEAKAKKMLVEEATVEKKIEEKKSVDESVGKESILMPEERKFSVLYKIWSRFSDQTCVGRSKRYREINEENMERDNGENKRKRDNK